MDITIKIEKGSNTKLSLDENGGKITLQAQHPRDVVFFRRHSDGEYHSSLESEREWSTNLQKAWLDVSAPGIYEIKADFLADTGCFEVYQVEAVAHLTVEVKAPPAETGSLKAELEAMIAEAIAAEDKRLNAEINKYFTMGKEALIRAAKGAQRSAVLAEAFPVSEYNFEASEKDKPGQPLELFAEYACTPMMKGLLTRFHAEHIAVKLHQKNQNFRITLVI